MGDQLTGQVVFVGQGEKFSHRGVEGNRETLEGSTEGTNTREHFFLVSEPPEAFRNSKLGDEHSLFVALLARAF